MASRPLAPSPRCAGERVGERGRAAFDADEAFDSRSARVNEADGSLRAYAARPSPPPSPRSTVGEGGRAWYTEAPPDNVRATRSAAPARTTARGRARCAAGPSCRA